MNKILSDYYKIRNQHDDALSALDDAVNRIVKTIMTYFKKRKSSWWAYSYYESEYDLPLPNKKIEDGIFEVYISEECDNGEFNYSTGFPIIFFDMTNEEIVKFLKEEENKAKLEQEMMVNTKKKNVEKQNNLKKSAIKKLTKEEKKALGL